TQAQRQQGINETLTQRSQPLNELAALIQGAPAIGTPQFNTPAQYGVQPADVMGATAVNQQGRWNAYNAAQQQQNAMLSGLFGLGGAGIIAASHSSLKEDIRPASGFLDGLEKLSIYRWRYKGEEVEHVGPMAEEFKDIFGCGDGKTLALVDVMGVLLGAIKELAHGHVRS